MTYLSKQVGSIVLLAAASLWQAHAPAQNGSDTQVATNAVHASAQQSSASPQGQAHRPNILFIIMDDVGIDQMQIFGYGGGTPPLTPNINALARGGVRFRNVWSMPECSPSRAIFFEGRYPLRTNVFNAILSDDLANSQVSPFEATTPKLLKKRNYQSALFGKFHLAGPNNNPYGDATPHVLGWDYFDGFLEGAPHPIDTTLGGQFDASSSPYTCGFVPDARFTGGANTGACHQPDNTCAVISKDAKHPVPGLSCLESGGIFVPNKRCDAPLKSPLQFSNDNAYYVWNRVINHPDGTVDVLSLNDPRTRGYVSDATVGAAEQWINMENSRNKSWMATVSFGNDHTPYQQPPRYLLPAATPDSYGFSCTGNTTKNEIATRIISNQMIEAMDTEIGHLMVNSGLASRGPDGRLDYHPEQTNTMVVIVGDNGTFAPGVKVPFDPDRAKGYVYQTGVWVPLIVSGPLVVSPGRQVNDMVNIADMFELFGEIAGIDVHQAVPKSHILDSQSMLPYLTQVNHPSIRQTNFTQTAGNVHLNDTAPPPCVVTLTAPPTCVQLFDSKPLCNFEGGVWYGPGGSAQYPSCCAVKNANVYPSGLQFVPDTQVATRNDDFKLVRKTVPDCSAPNAPDQTITEFYQINEKPLIPKIDKSGDDLCSATEGCPHGLNASQVKVYNALQAVMNATLTSEPPCPGDGNSDKVVNAQDLLNYFYFTIHNGLSSWYDFNHDGFTNAADLAVVQAHYGSNCLKK